jgi:hypothetical protein
MAAASRVNTENTWPGAMLSRTLVAYYVSLAAILLVLMMLVR